MRKTGFFWHIHHDYLVEYSNNIHERLDYIRRQKDSNEIDLRIKLLKPAKLPRELLTRISSYHNMNDLPAEVRRKLLQLHREQCHPQCPWKPYVGGGRYCTHGSILGHWDSKRCTYCLKPLPKKSKAKK